MPEPQEVSFTLNEKVVRARTGETVLSVAKRHEIAIPTLCHHQAVAPYGACRLCMVEVFWGKRSKLVTSCIYLPYENDRVETNNERVRRARRMILELLLARCPEVELIQALGREYGLETTRFHTEGGESSSERCILCGLCVRVCGEVVRRHAIGFADRGVDRIVATPFDSSPEECIGCGACVFICPTGALHYQDLKGERIIAELKVKMPLVKCRACGTPFATAEHIAYIRERLGIPDEVSETCPVCRGSEHGSAMEKVLAFRRSRFESPSMGKGLLEAHHLDMRAFRYGGE